jgi:hypothetical protein
MYVCVCILLIYAQLAYVCSLPALAHHAAGCCGLYCQKTGCGCSMPLSPLELYDPVPQWGLKLMHDALPFQLHATILFSCAREAC